MPLRPRPEIERIAPCPHGGPIYEEMEHSGFGPQDILDFSVSANPFGPPEGVQKAMTSAAIDQYPDSDSNELRSVLAKSLGIHTENIIVGNGSMEIIRMIATAYFSNDEIIIPQPTFGEYEVACKICGSTISGVMASEDNKFLLDIDEMETAVCDRKPKAVFLCNPNNPTGQYLDKLSIEKLVDSSEDTLFVLDEAYVGFVANPWQSINLIERDNVIMVRSMTKDYTLAGLRLGYAVADTAIIATLQKVKPPWNVNSVAQCAGVAALQDTGFVDECRANIQKVKEYLTKQLEQIGMVPLDSDAHFFLVKVGNATEFRKDLLALGIMVRDCTSFGLPDYVRIAPRTITECEKLIEAVRLVRG